MDVNGGLAAVEAAEQLPGRLALLEPATPARSISRADWRRYEGYLGEILEALGLEPDTPGTRETPQRLLRALFDSTSGYDGDPKLLTTFPSESKEPSAEALGQIVEGPIAFHALCEHHALPFYGVAHVGYVAGEEIIGISKLTRLVRLFTKRFTVQERVGEQIADTLMELIDAGRRGRPPRGLPPVHADARRRRALRDGDDVLARRLRRPRAAPGVPDRGARPQVGRMTERDPLELLYESPAAPPSELTAPLSSLYGGGLGFAGPTVFTNFVVSLDGSVALPEIPKSNALIGAGSEADRFVMGLLRALADVVVIGSGTLRSSPTGTWSPAGPHPASASLFAELRLLRGQPERPELAILTGSGAIDVRHPALARRVVILTSTTGEARLRSRVPETAELIRVDG